MCANLDNSEKIKCAIEAILFMSPRSITINRLHKNLNVSKSLIKLEIKELIKDYNKKTTAIKIAYDDNKVEMVLKPEFIDYNAFASGKNLSNSELKTLALISLNAPVEQSKITKRRPYYHLKTLHDLDLIKIFKKGRKNVLDITRKFEILYGKKIKR